MADGFAEQIEGDDILTLAGNVEAPVVHVPAGHTAQAQSRGLLVHLNRDAAHGVEPVDVVCAEHVTYLHMLPSLHPPPPFGYVGSRSVSTCSADTPTRSA